MPLIFNKKTIFLIFLLAVGFAVVGLAKTAGAVNIHGTVWNKTFDGIEEDSGYAIQKTNDSGYIIAGFTRSKGAGEEDIWLIKTDSQGNEVWNKTFGGKETDSARSIQQTADGGYIIAGSTGSFGNNVDFWIIKTDGNGQTCDYTATGSCSSNDKQNWVKTFGGSDSDLAISVQQTFNINKNPTGYIIAGSTLILEGQTIRSDFRLIKTDSEGNEVWNKTFGGSDFNVASSVQLTTDGGYIVAGYKEFVELETSDFLLIKTDSEGNEVWNKTFGMVGLDKAYSVQQTVDGGYIVAGFLTTDAKGEDFWLIKTNENGLTCIYNNTGNCDDNNKWAKTFGGNYADKAYAVQKTNDGGYIVAGSTRSPSAGEEDFWLIKTDHQGNEVWNKTFGGSAPDEAWSVQQTTPDIGYIIAGYTKSFSSKKADLWIIKTSSNPTLAPFADFSPSTTIGRAPLTIKFTNKSTGTQNSWKWLFGDKDAESTAQDPSYTYKTPGNYTVSLTATNEYGFHEKNIVNLITVQDPIFLPPSSNFIASKTTATPNEVINFTNTSTGSDLVYSWNFGDGSPLSNTRDATHSYAIVNTYTVSLTVSNGGGSSEKKQDIIIKPSISTPPTAAFTASPNPAVPGQQINFTNQTTGIEPITYLWDFGDKSPTSTLKDLVNVYTNTGAYAVSLTATNEFGSNKITNTITINCSQEFIKADLNSNDVIDLGDLLAVVEHWAETGSSAFIPEDVNKDGAVNLSDLLEIINQWAKECK